MRGRSPPPRRSDCRLVAPRLVGHRRKEGTLRPTPVSDFRHILTMLIDVPLVLDQLVLQALPEMIAAAADLRQPIDGVHDQVKTVHVVEYRHVERGGDGAFLFVTSNMQVGMVMAA